VRGEPDIGKTALLRYAAETVRDFQVTHADGEREADVGSRPSAEPGRAWSSAWSCAVSRMSLQRRQLTAA
jgi:hypothetical protein